MSECCENYIVVDSTCPNIVEVITCPQVVVSGVIDPPVNDILAGDYISIINDDGVYTISATGISSGGLEKLTTSYVIAIPGDDLSIKYDIAKGLTPHGNPLSSSNRATFIIMPGAYNLSSELEIDTEFVDILGLGSMKLDRGCKTAVTLLTNTINVSANDVRVKGISVGTQQFKIGNNLPLQVIEDCSGGNLSFGSLGGTVSGTFTNCTGDAYSFGGSGTGAASGTFTNCSGGIYSFGGYATASGSFTNCAATSSGFGGFGGIASGSFKDCASGGVASFGGGNISSGTFTNCTAGMYSFGGGASGTASGTFNNCSGGEYSFGGLGGTASGKFFHCTLTTGTFQTPSGTGKYRLCIDGNYDVINADAPTP